MDIPLTLKTIIQIIICVIDMMKWAIQLKIISLFNGDGKISKSFFLFPNNRIGQNVHRKEYW